MITINGTCYVVIWDTDILQREKISNTDPTEIPVLSPGARERLRLCINFNSVVLYKFLLMQATFT